LLPVKDSRLAVRRLMEVHLPRLSNKSDFESRLSHLRLGEGMMRPILEERRRDVEKGK
jgi:hypothetical protein